MTRPRKSKRAGALVRDVIEAALMAAVLFLVLRLFVQNTIVDGPSMIPNFVDGQWLLVNKLAYRLGEPVRGDVIVFWAPDGSDKEFIKRVIALPGESVAIRGGVVTIDGVGLDEAWRPNLDRASFGPYTVPEGSVFVLGDNRPFSNDSRTWVSDGSALDRDRIVGRAWLSVWPASKWGVVSLEEPGAVSAASTSAE